MKIRFYCILTISILLTNCSDPVSSEISHNYEFIVQYENTGVWKDNEGLYHLKNRYDQLADTL